MKRRLKTAYGMTPDEYRKKWNLRHDYPMTAQNYSAARSALAKDLGLGRRAVPAVVAAKGTRGRGRKNPPI
jgi:predicted transcriptional regulator